jgi:hypothetical protein
MPVIRVTSRLSISLPHVNVPRISFSRLVHDETSTSASSSADIPSDTLSPPSTLPTDIAPTDKLRIPSYPGDNVRTLKKKPSILVSRSNPTVLSSSLFTLCLLFRKTERRPPASRNPLASLLRLTTAYIPCRLIYAGWRKRRGKSRL